MQWSFLLDVKTKLSEPKTSSNILSSMQATYFWNHKKKTKQHLHTFYNSDNHNKTQYNLINHYIKAIDYFIPTKYRLNVFIFYFCLLSFFLVFLWLHLIYSITSRLLYKSISSNLLRLISGKVIREMIWKVRYNLI
jgi:hypothetical protein